MTARVIKPTPKMGIGAGVTELLQQALRVARGATIAYAATDYPTTVAVVTDIFQVYPGINIIEVNLQIDCAWPGTSGSNALTIGDSDDADRFMVNATALSSVAGLKRGAPATLPFTVTSSDPMVIQLTFATSGSGTTNAGSMTPWLIYCDRISSDT
jgi:hypothetical protein